jgi:hypothetical protein
MSVLSKADILAAQQGDPRSLGKLLNEVDQTFVRLQQQGGYQLSGEDASQSLAAPPLAPVWTVTGIDNAFIVRIQPAQVNLSQQATTQGAPAPGDPTRFTALPLKVAQTNQVQVNVFYQIQSSKVTTFADASLLNYPASGSSPQLAYDIKDHPNEIRYWRIRARYLNSPFGPWYPLNGASGMLAVDSSFERSISIAPRSPLNRTNDAKFDSVVTGGTDTIRGYSNAGGVGSSITMLDGQGGSQVIGACTILGAAQDTDYAVVWSPTTLFRAFPIATQYKQTILDALYFLASLHTVKADGSGGAAGGGGDGGGGFSGNIGGRQVPSL